MRGYSYRLGQTELFKHLADIKVNMVFSVLQGVATGQPLKLTSHLQRVHDSEYAYIMDVQLNPNGKGHVLGVVSRI
jgi:hypothetical protein